jgi:hypothetical protein
VYGHLKLYCLFVLECYAWYIHGTMVGRRAETGATLSANHVYPVGGVAHERVADIVMHSLRVVPISDHVHEKWIL